MAIAPPRPEQIYTGGVSEDFEVIGRQWVDYFVDHCGLRPSDSVLDVGSGIGRVAIPLTEYLTGRYEGLEPVKDGFDWCVANVASRFPNFHFTRADIYNAFYNPEGAHQPTEYRFPYEDESFDFVYLISIFTHMLPPETEHYISEIRRVLNPGGRCLATACLMNDRVPPVELRMEHLRLDEDAGPYCFNRGRPPEEVLGYKEDFLLGLFARHGFSITVDYGWWTEPEIRDEPRTNKDGQDAVLATSPSP